MMKNWLEQLSTLISPNSAKLKDSLLRTPLEPVDVQRWSYPPIFIIKAGICKLLLEKEIFQRRKDLKFATRLQITFAT